MKEVTSGDTFNNFDTKAILKNIDNQLQEELQAKAKAKSHQLQAEADAYFQDSNEQQTGQFNTALPVGPFKLSLPKRPPPTGPQRHVKHPKKLRKLNPKDKSKSRGNRRSPRFQDMNVHAVNSLITPSTNDISCKQSSFII